MAGIVIPHGRRRGLAVLVVALVTVGVWAGARSAATVPLAPTVKLRVDTSRPGSEFAPGTVGLSTETRELSTGQLSAAHYSLVRLMRLLGPALLRIGGNSVDSSWWTSSGEPPPSWATSTVTPADLSALHGLLATTGWQVLLGVDLGHFEPARAADEARYARQILGTSLLGVEIGNEPSGYGRKKDSLRPPTYGVAEYLREVDAYRQALGAAAPGVAVYGPALSQESPWLTEFGAAESVFSQITQHYYPASTCPSPPSGSSGTTRSPESPGLPGEAPVSTTELPTAAGLLSPAVRQEEDELIQMLVQAGAVAHRPVRVGETNDSACGGTPSVSPVFASALWALDWSLRAASGGVRGLNFHGNLGVCGPNAQSPICAPGAGAAADGDVVARPEYYGLLAARQLEGGRFVPTRIFAHGSSGHGPPPDLTSWATLAPGGKLRIAIDNLAAAGLAQPVSISVPGYGAGAEEMLSGPSALAKNGIALGAARVSAAGQWRPRPVSLSSAHGAVRVVVPPTGAAIVTLYRRDPHG
jgi:hypothetical protein